MHLRTLALNLLAEILMYYILICPHYANLINVYVDFTHTRIGHACMHGSISILDLRA